MRGTAHLHLFWSGKCKWPKWSERRESEFLCSHMQKDVYYSSWQPLWAFYKLSTRHFRSHLSSIDTLWRMISARSELQFVCCVWGFTRLLLQKNKCQLLAKGCRLQDSRLSTAKPSVRRDVTSSICQAFHHCFLSCLPSREGNDSVRLLGLIDS